MCLQLNDAQDQFRLGSQPILEALGTKQEYILDVMLVHHRAPCTHMYTLIHNLT